MLTNHSCDSCSTWSATVFRRDNSAKALVAKGVEFATGSEFKLPLPPPLEDWDPSLPLLELASWLPVLLLAVPMSVPLAAPI